MYRNCFLRKVRGRSVRGPIFTFYRKLSMYEAENALTRLPQDLNTLDEILDEPEFETQSQYITRPTYT
jgi:hypothetical protein